MPLSDEDFEQARPTMHSSDRTLLAKLGFADADKGNKEHDLACMYLKQDDTIRSIVDWMVRGEFQTDYGRFKLVGGSAKAAMEVHIEKGDGKYATTIGFADVVYTVKTGREGTITSEQKRNYSVPGNWETVPCEPRPCKDDYYTSWKVIFEVKIGRVQIGDVIRQLKLYTRHLECSPPLGLPRCILVAPWDITEAEHDALLSCGIDFLRLGKGFQEWKSASEKTSKTKEI